jgi:hypothetical protein
MEDEKLSQLTAREFFEEWEKQHTFGAADDWLEFAEAYAAELREERNHWAREAHGLAGSQKEIRVLLRRAAELLMRSRQMPKDWDWSGDRSKWFIDAGMEEGK